MIAGILDQCPAIPMGFAKEIRQVARCPDSLDAAAVAEGPPIGGRARSPFLGAPALLTFDDMGPKPGPAPRLLISIFGLTGAEAKLATLIAGGAALDATARQLEISRETASNQLKSVFTKTETHRQSELVALLSRLRAASTD